MFMLTSDAAPLVLLDDDPRLEGWEVGDPRNLILIGGPAHNARTNRIAGYWRDMGHAAAWDAAGQLSIGGCAYGGAGVGALLLGPRPVSRRSVATCLRRCRNARVQVLQA